MKKRWQWFKVSLAQCGIDFCESRMFADQDCEDIKREIWWGKMGYRFLIGFW